MNFNIKTNNLSDYLRENTPILTALGIFLFLTFSIYELENFQFKDILNHIESISVTLAHDAYIIDDFCNNHTLNLKL